MTQEEGIKASVEAIKTIKSKYEVEVIKEYEIPPIVNTKTGKTTGHAVVIRLNTKYDYDDNIIETWKGLLNADEWSIRATKNQLWITFRIHY